MFVTDNLTSWSLFLKRLLTQFKSIHFIVRYNISVPFLAVVSLKEILYWCLEGCHWNRSLLWNILPNWCSNRIWNQRSNLASINKLENLSLLLEKFASLLCGSRLLSLSSIMYFTSPLLWIFLNPFVLLFSLLLFFWHFIQLTTTWNIEKNQTKI